MKLSGFVLDTYYIRYTHLHIMYLLHLHLLCSTLPLPFTITFICAEASVNENINIATLCWQKYNYVYYLQELGITTVNCSKNKYIYLSLNLNERVNGKITEK